MRLWCLARSDTLTIQHRRSINPGRDFQTRSRYLRTLFNHASKVILMQPHIREAFTHGGFCRHQHRFRMGEHRIDRRKLRGQRIGRVVPLPCSIRSAASSAFGPA